MKAKFDKGDWFKVRNRFLNGQVFKLVVKDQVWHAFIKWDHECQVIKLQVQGTDFKSLDIAPSPNLFKVNAF